MGVITSQMINNYYSRFKDTEVTFNKSVMTALSLLPKQVYLKSSDFQLPCIVYSASMTGAKVIANLPSSVLQRFNDPETHISLRFCFKNTDVKDSLITFFVGSRVKGISPYPSGNGNLYFIQIFYNKRPPDDLIERLGILIDANQNATDRKEERIIINDEVLRKINLAKKNCILAIEGIPRNCIIRDLSFSGAKVLIVGLAKLMINRKCRLSLDLKDSNKVLELEGIILRKEEVEGHKDISAIAIQYIPETVPVEYKILINDYLTQIRK